MAANSPTVTLILGELQRARKQRGLSIETLARQIGVSEPTVSRWLRGQGLTIDALDDLCQCIGTDLRTLIEEASEPATERFSLRQERILAGDRLLSLIFFLVLNGAQPEALERDFHLSGFQFNQLTERLIRLGLVQRGSKGRLRPLVSRSVRWRPEGPLAQAFERTVLSIFFGSNFSRASTRYVSQFALLDEAGREFFHSRFEALCEEVIRGSGYAGRPAPGSEWSALFMMARPLSIDEMRDWTKTNDEIESPPPDDG